MSWRYPQGLEHFPCGCRVGFPHLWAFSAMKTPLHSYSGIPSNRENALKPRRCGSSDGTAEAVPLSETFAPAVRNGMRCAEGFTIVESQQTSSCRASLETSALPKMKGWSISPVGPEHPYLCGVFRKNTPHRCPFRILTNREKRPRVQIEPAGATGGKSLSGSNTLLKKFVREYMATSAIISMTFASV